MPNNNYPSFYYPWNKLRVSEANNEDWVDLLANPPERPTGIVCSNRRTRTDKKPALAVWDYIATRPPGKAFHTENPTFKDALVPRRNINTWWSKYQHGLMYDDHDRSLILEQRELNPLSEKAHYNVHIHNDDHNVDLNDRRSLCSYTSDFLNELATLVVEAKFGCTRDSTVKAYGVLGTHFDDKGWVSIPAVDLFDKVTSVIVVAIIPGTAGAHKYSPESAVIVGHSDVVYISEGAIFKPSFAGYKRVTKFSGNFHYRLAHQELKPFSGDQVLPNSGTSERIYHGPAFPCRKCLLIDPTIEGIESFPRGYPPKNFKAHPEWEERYKDLTAELKDVRATRKARGYHFSNSEYLNGIKETKRKHAIKIRNLR